MTCVANPTMTAEEQRLAEQVRILRDALRAIMAEVDTDYGPCLVHDPQWCAKCAARAVLAKSEAA